MVRIVDFVDEGLRDSPYLIDLGDGSAAVIDPTLSRTAHETLACRDGLALASMAAGTHSHADYVTGSQGLAGRLETTTSTLDASPLESPDAEVTDGQHVDLGNECWLTPIATSRYTQVHQSFLLEVDP